MSKNSVCVKHAHNKIAGQCHHLYTTRRKKRGKKPRSNYCPLGPKSQLLSFRSRLGSSTETSTEAFGAEIGVHTIEERPEGAHILAVRSCRGRSRSLTSRFKHALSVGEARVVDGETLARQLARVVVHVVHPNTSWGRSRSEHLGGFFIDRPSAAYASIRPSEQQRGSFAATERGDGGLIVLSRGLCIFVLVGVTTPAIQLVAVQGTRVVFCRANGATEKGPTASVGGKWKARFTVKAFNGVCNRRVNIGLVPHSHG